MRRGVALVLAAALCAPASAGAQTPPLTVPSLRGFRSVLAQGEGQQLNAVDFGAYELSGAPLATYANQQPLYVGIMPQAGALQPPDLDRFYKSTKFGEVPGGVGSHSTPRPGVDIYRDASFGMAHVYGATPADVPPGRRAHFPAPTRAWLRMDAFFASLAPHAYPHLGVGW